MIKKIVSGLLVSAMAVSAMPVNVSAVDNTDFLNVPNYYYDTALNEDSITGYSYESIVPAEEIESYVELTDGTALYSDANFGISLIEILCHNGLISPQEIGGKETLREISDSEEVRGLISAYQNQLDTTDFKNYFNYLFKSTTAREKIHLLLNIAENSQENNKYFLIMYGSYRNTPSELEKAVTNTAEGGKSRVQKAHSAVGTGIEKGSWTFDGRSFDRRIPTLDSVNTGEKTADDTCIYINSATDDFYVPKYSENLENDLHIVAIDDDKLLNYGGAVNPTNAYNSDISDIYNISVTGKNDSCLYEITLDDETVMNRENDYLDNYHNPYNGNFFVKADKIEINRVSFGNVENIKINNIDESVNMELKNADSVLTAENGLYTLKRTFTPDGNFGEDSVLSYDFELNSPKDSRVWSFSGETSEEITFSLHGSADSDCDGVIFKGSAEIAVNDGISGKNSVFAVSSQVPVLILADSQNNDVKFLTDSDGDGIFEHETQTGDVNFDGFIDAGDASDVLAGYAALSTGNNCYINLSLADFNGDSLVDASDASDILAEYARLSTMTAD